VHVDREWQAPLRQRGRNPAGVYVGFNYYALCYSVVGGNRSSHKHKRYVVNKIRLILLVLGVLLFLPVVVLGQPATPPMASPPPVEDKQPEIDRLQQQVNGLQQQLDYANRASTALQQQRNNALDQHAGLLIDANRTQEKLAAANARIADLEKQVENLHNAQKIKFKTMIDAAKGAPEAPKEEKVPQ
jgi:septal ring factor EnvC (AmiA/AmiB activator)